MKTNLVNFRTTEEQTERLQKVAKSLDIPYSQIVREAINEKLDRLENKEEEKDVAIAA